MGAWHANNMKNLDVTTCRGWRRSEDPTRVRFSLPIAPARLSRQIMLSSLVAHHEVMEADSGQGEARQCCPSVRS